MITNILSSSSSFLPLCHLLSLFSRPFFHLNTVFLEGTCMATARFDMSVAMEEHFNNCGFRLAALYYLLIGCSMSLISLSFELGSALSYLERFILNFPFLRSVQ